MVNLVANPNKKQNYLALARDTSYLTGLYGLDKKALTSYRGYFALGSGPSNVAAAAEIELVARGAVGAPAAIAEATEAGRDLVGVLAPLEGSGSPTLALPPTAQLQAEIQAAEALQTPLSAAELVAEGASSPTAGAGIALGTAEAQVGQRSEQAAVSILEPVPWAKVTPVAFGIGDVLGGVFSVWQGADDIKAGHDAKGSLEVVGGALSVGAGLLMIGAGIGLFAAAPVTIAALTVAGLGCLIGSWFL